MGGPSPESGSLFARDFGVATPAVPGSAADSPVPSVAPVPDSAADSSVPPAVPVPDSAAGSRLPPGVADHEATPPAVATLTGRERIEADPGLRVVWLLIVLVVMAGGVALIALGQWQAGAATTGAGMIVAALIRAAVPSRDVGLLRVRTKVIDVTGMLAVGIGIIAMVLSRS